MAENKKIPITYECKPPRHRERWTEEMTDSYITTTEMVVYHYSDFPVYCFSPEKTCFFLEYREPGENIYGHKEKCYKLTIPVGTEVWEYGNEIRLILTEDMEIFECHSSENPDMAIPLAIGSGIAGGTAYALASKALEKNPTEQMCMLYRKIKQKYPGLDYQTFQEAYDIAIQEPFMSYKEYHRDMKALGERIKELNRKIDFAYSNMGYVDTKSEEERNILFEEQSRLEDKARRWAKEHPEWLPKDNPGRIGDIREFYGKRHKLMGVAYHDKKAHAMKGYFEEWHRWIESRKEWSKTPSFYVPVKKQNPPSPNARYETFHGIPVDKTFKANIPDPKGKLTPIAKIDHVVYECAGKKAVGDDGEDISYIHRWKRAKMILVRDAAKNYFIAGKCRVVKSGINDYRGKPTWSMKDFKLPRTPKKVTYLGFIPEIKAGGRLYKFKDTILCTDSRGQYLFLTELIKAQPSHPR